MYLTLSYLRFALPSDGSVRLYLFIVSEPRLSVNSTLRKTRLKRRFLQLLFKKWICSPFRFLGDVVSRAKNKVGTTHARTTRGPLRKTAWNCALVLIGILLCGRSLKVNSIVMPIISLFARCCSSTKIINTNWISCKINAKQKFYLHNLMIQNVRNKKWM